MNYIRSLYHRAAGLLLSLSDLDNLHRKVPILSPPLSLAARLSLGRKKEREREREIYYLSRFFLSSYAVRQYAYINLKRVL